MKRGGPLRRTTGLTRRTRLAPVSARRRATLADRAEVRAAALARDRGCVAREVVPEVACAGPLDADEIVSRARRPGGELDLANVQILCRAHHDWKHAHPSAAVVRGLAGWSWSDGVERGPGRGSHPTLD